MQTSQGARRQSLWCLRQREIKHMEALGKKLELEALSNKHFSFITEEYLP